ncbi:MAG: M23/M56 family metallopeptidase [Hyphomonadaceae bacterium]|nr:M23/M56 family metallopeptidase [Hyphomonadaceae bacterium]
MSALWFIAFSLLWTGLLAGGAQFLSREPVPARFAHTIWRGAAFLAFLPWVIAGIYAVIPTPMATPIPDMPYIGGAAEVLSTNAAVQAATASSATPIIGMILMAVLLTGWAARFGLNMLCQIRLQSIKRMARPNPDVSARRWAKALGLGHIPATASIPHGSPFLAGIGQRTIYLPDAITDQEDADIILAHECTHIARGDLLSRPFERLVADVFWFSPFAWMMRRELDYWREAATDEQTAALTGDNVAYARALANTARVTRPMPQHALPVAAFILPRHETLKKRLTQLLERDARKPRQRMAIMALAAGLVLAPLSLAQATSVVTNSIFTHPVLATSSKITAPFGEVYYEWEDTKKWHYGVDLGAKMQTVVYAPADAKVLWKGKKDGYGYTVDILFEDGRKMRFSSLHKIKVDKGQKLKAGDVIGLVGKTAPNSTGPHLHLEVYKDGEHVDPQKVKGLKLYKS